MTEERVQKFMQQSGLYSRRKAEELISLGKVKVNNVIVKLGEKCTQSDQIKVDGKILDCSSKNKVYILMNKPTGFVCSNDDPHNKKTVFDLLDVKYKKQGLFTIGRLDKDTTGLLILTNDGDFSNKVIHPSKKIAKEYEVFLNKKLDAADLKKLERGIVLDDYKLKECVIKDFKTKYRVKIFEGRKRQIRRMFESVGYRVEKLERVKIGKLDLKRCGLRYGKYKELPLEFFEKELF